MKRLSRSERYEIAKGKIQEAFQETQALIEELQRCFDNMPENLRYSETGQAIKGTIDQLYKVYNSLGNVWIKEISFPGAYD